MTGRIGIKNAFCYARSDSGRHGDTTVLLTLLVREFYQGAVVRVLTDILNIRLKINTLYNVYERDGEN